MRILFVCLFAICNSLIVSAQFFSNGDFENGSSDPCHCPTGFSCGNDAGRVVDGVHPQWTVGNNGCVTEGTNFAPQLGAYSGTGSVYFYAGADYLQSQSVNFSSSTEICFEVWYCGPQGSGASGQNTSLAYFSFGVDDSQVGPTVPVPTNTPWTQHTYTMTLSAGNHTFSILSGGAAQYSFWFDDFYVTDCGEPPSSDFTVESPVCVGENATITYTGNASSGATYNWDFDGGNASPGSGQGPHEVNWDADGSYTISLTVDEGGSSSGATTQTVTVNPTPTADFSISGPDCYGDNVNITYTGTGSASAIFNWDFPGANIVSGSGEGPYVLQYPTPGSYNIGLDVTENGCTSQVNSQSLNMPVLLELSADATDLSCYGYEDGSITLNASGGTPAYIYSWPGGGSGATQNALAAGTYSISVSDANGCSAETTLTIQQPSEIILSTGTDANICYGETGSLTASASGGAGVYSYFWNDGNGFMEAASPLAVNPDTDTEYSVFAQDAAGCNSDTANIMVNLSDQIILDLDIEDASCGGYCNGQALASTSGGSPPYSYSWDGQGNAATDLCEGSYSVSVTDNIGCTASEDFVIHAPPVIIMDMSATNASCFGGDDGTASCEVSGGNPPYVFYWSNGYTSETISGLDADVYEVTISDASGCTATDSVTVGQASQVQITADDLLLCRGDDAVMYVLVSGGTAPYAYFWGDGELFEQGTYVQTEYPVEEQSYYACATDANGCKSDTIKIDVSFVPEILVDFEVQNVACYGDYNGALRAKPSGGMRPFEYLWTHYGNPVSRDSTISGAGAGMYYLEVTDANGCMCDTFVEITQPEELTAGYMTQRPSCINYGDGSITLEAQGGTPPYSYGFAGMEFSTPHFDSLYSGVYNFLIEDAHGCRVALQNIILNDNPEICLDIPNVITPNGDNINDTWIIENLEMYPDAIVKVFNRWGQQMFQGSPGMDPWDGTCSETEKKVPTGAYMYSIELNNKFSPICGIITVVY